MTGAWRGWAIMAPLLIVSFLSSALHGIGAMFMAMAEAVEWAEGLMTKWAIDLDDPLERKAMLASEYIASTVRALFLGFVIGLISGAIAILLAAAIFNLIN